MNRQLWTATALVFALAAKAQAQPEDSLIAVSADIVEISGSVQRDIGFSWTPFCGGIGFAEKTIPGIYRLGDFARQTQLQTQLKMLETEGKAQLLSNPKVVVQAQSQANFVVGGEIPYPSANGNGTVTADFKKFGVILNIVPVINPNKKDTIRAEMQLEVSNADFSKVVQVGNTSVPSIVTARFRPPSRSRAAKRSSSAALKSSTKTVAKTKVPYIGSIPLSDDSSRRPR